MRDKELREQFARIGGQFDKIDARFEKIDDQFEKIDARFEKVDARFEEMLRVIVQTNAETRRILAREIINTRDELGARIDAVDQKLEGFRDETHTNFDDVYRRFDRLETEYYSISAGLSRVEKKISEEPQA